jgi:hypothetical protein
MVKHMQNLKIIFDNSADAATITASSTSASLVAANMQSDIKSRVHRSAGLSVSYTLTWVGDVSVGGVALPATNLSGASTIRIRLYNAANALLADSGVNPAAPGLNLGLWNWSQPINANTFAYGGVAKTSYFFDQHYTARKCVIDLVDTSADLAGYIDCSRIVAGPYWSPSITADFGASVSIVDTSNTQRSEAGDLISNRGTMYDKLSFSMGALTETDRAGLMLLIRKSGVARNIFVSLLPDCASDKAEQDFMIYGKRANNDIKYDYVNRFSNSFEVEGW